MQAKAANEKYDEAVDGYFARHRVKPGSTGWAQIHGWRGETDTEEKIQQRVDHDLYYIEHWSIRLDIYILAVTPFALIRAGECVLSAAQAQCSPAANFTSPPPPCRSGC